MLFGPFYLTKDALPVMRRGKWGRIVNMGSIHSVVASVNKSAYTAAKHGLLGFTRATALEAAADGITVNCVCPTYVNTSLVTNQIAPQARTLGISEEQVVSDVMLGPAAVKRFLEVDEVAALVRYLCSGCRRGHHRLGPDDRRRLDGEVDAWLWLLSPGFASCWPDSHPIHRAGGAPSRR